MGVLLDFQFIVVLNLFVLLLWPGSAPYTGTGNQRNALGVILLAMTVIAIVIDIVFIVLKLVH